jgi:hypothetical protein
MQGGYTLPDALLCLILSDGRYSFLSSSSQSEAQTQHLPIFNRLLRQLFPNPTLSQWGSIAQYSGSYMPTTRNSVHTDPLFRLQGMERDETLELIAYVRGFVLGAEGACLRTPVMKLSDCAEYNKRMKGTSGASAFGKWVGVMWRDLKVWLGGVVKDEEVFGAVRLFYPSTHLSIANTITYIHQYSQYP